MYSKFGVAFISAFHELDPSMCDHQTLNSSLHDMDPDMNSALRALSKNCGLQCFRNTRYLIAPLCSVVFYVGGLVARRRCKACMKGTKNVGGKYSNKIC